MEEVIEQLGKEGKQELTVLLLGGSGRRAMQGAWRCIAARAPRAVAGLEAGPVGFKLRRIAFMDCRQGRRGQEQHGQLAAE